MGNKKFNLTKLALAMGVTLGLSGCFSDNDNNVDIKPPVEEKPEVIQVPKSDTKAALNFFVSATVVDATADTLTVVPNATVKFLEDGVASENITDVSGNAITEFTTPTGSLSFNLKDGADISEVTLLVSAEGFLSKSLVVNFGDKNSVVKPVIRLSKRNAETLSIAEKTGSANDDGTLTEELALATTDGAGVAVSTNVALQDIDGNPVSGDVSVSVVTAPLEAEKGKSSAIDIIPEGFNTAANDNANEVAVPAAYLEVQMSAGDTPIRKFGSDITLTTNVKGDFAKGDKFDVTSYDKNTAKWTKETIQAELGDGNDMMFPASFKTNHLTGFLLTKPSPVCSTGLTYTVKNANVPEGGLFVGLLSPTFSTFTQITANQGTLVPATDAKASGLAQSTTGLIAVFDVNDNSWGSLQQTSLCGEVEIGLVAPQVTYVDENLDLSFSCQNASDTDAQLALGGAVVTYSQAGKIPLVAAPNSTPGSYKLSGLVNGETYTVNVDTRIANFTVEPFTITADGTNEANNTARAECVVEPREVTGTGGS